MATARGGVAGLRTGAGHLKAADELSHFLQGAHGGGEGDALKLATQADETFYRGDEVDTPPVADHRVDLVQDGGFDARQQGATKGPDLRVGIRKVDLLQGGTRPAMLDE